MKSGGKKERGQLGSALLLPKTANSQLESLVSDIIPIIHTRRIRHRHQHPPNHHGDIDRLGAEVEVLDGNVSENDGSEYLDSLLGHGSPRVPSGAGTRPPNDLDPRPNVIETLLLRLHGDGSARFGLERLELLDIDGEACAELLVVAADDLDNLARGDDAHGAKDDGDGDVLVDRVVLEVDLGVLGVDVGLGFAFEGGTGGGLRRRGARRGGRRGRREGDDEEGGRG